MKFLILNNEFVNYAVPKSTVSFLKDKKGMYGWDVPEVFIE